MTWMDDKFRCALTLPTGDALDVREVGVDERLNGLFCIRIVAVSHNPDVDFEAVIGQPAAFTIEGWAAAEPRHRRWTGICRRLDQLGIEPAGSRPTRSRSHPRSGSPPSGATTACSRASPTSTSP
jgi:uncharacterized protein involved in type VI secretion and phage assembly